MTIAFEAPGVVLHHGDCIEVMRTLPDNSVDAVVTDPPYGLEFMGKGWDGADGFRRSLNAADAGRDSVFGRTSKTSPEYRTESKAAAGMNRTGYTDAERLERPSFMGGLNPKCLECGKWQRGGNPCTCEAPSFTNERLPRLHSFQEWCEVWASEALRVLKPGGHMVAFGGSRTWHRLASAVEDAGFEIRDSIAWLYGSGFPKSMDVSKAIDNAAGAVRPTHERPAFGGTFSDDQGTTYGTVIDGTPITEDAARWMGWGTALKPAFEPIVVGRKPLVGTVAANVLKHGTGALNIDVSRTEATDAQLAEKYASVQGAGHRANSVYGKDERDRAGAEPHPAGRWPTNVLVDESQSLALDPDVTRFFPTFRYQAKAPQEERPNVRGVQHPTVKPLDLMRWLCRLVTPPNGTILEPFAGSGTTLEAAALEGFSVIGIEREAEYLPLIEARLSKPLQVAMFGDWEDTA